DARERAARRARRAARDLEVQPTRRVDGQGRLELHREARAALQPAARPGLRVDRLRAVHAAGQRPRRALGRDRQGRVRHPRGPRPGRLMDPLIILFGFGVGVLVGTTGIGGGSLMTPILILVFGFKPTTAIGTDLAYGAITKTVGGYRHWKQSTVDFGLSTWMAFGSVPAA